MNANTRTLLTLSLAGLVMSTIASFTGPAFGQLIGHYPLDAAAGGTTPDTTGINGS